jgi:hypothetical protein
MEIIVITLYFVIEAGLGLALNSYYLGKDVKSLFILPSLLYNIIILRGFDIDILCSFVCKHPSLFGYFFPFEFG